MTLADSISNIKISSVGDQLLFQKKEKVTN